MLAKSPTSKSVGQPMTKDKHSFEKYSVRQDIKNVKKCYIKRVIKSSIKKSRNRDVIDNTTFVNLKENIYLNLV